MKVWTCRRMWLSWSGPAGSWAAALGWALPRLGYQTTREAWLAAWAAARAREARRIANEEPRTMTMTSRRKQEQDRGVDRLLTVEEAAERLGTSTRFVRRLLAERRIAYVKVGRHVRLDPADVEAFIAASRVEVRPSSVAALPADAPVVLRLLVGW